MGALVGAYEKKYGVKSASGAQASEKVLQRAVAEARAKPQHRGHRPRPTAPKWSRWHREKGPAAGQVAASRRSHRAGYAPSRRVGGNALNVFVQATTPSRSERGSAQDLEDLLDPKWKGKLGIEQEDSDWLAGLFGDLGEAKGTKFSRRSSQKTACRWRKGHTLLAQLVVRVRCRRADRIQLQGEQFKERARPIDWFSIGTAIARPKRSRRRAPRPASHAAVLFYDFEISEEGQRNPRAARLRADEQENRTRRSNQLPLKFVDARVTLDEYDKW